MAEHAITVDDFVAERLTCWVPVRVASALVACHPSTLYRWIHAGRLHLATDGRRGDRWLVFVEAVRAVALERKRARA